MKNVFIVTSEITNLINLFDFESSYQTYEDAKEAINAVDVFENHIITELPKDQASFIELLSSQEFNDSEEKRVILMEEFLKLDEKARTDLINLTQPATLLAKANYFEKAYFRYIAIVTFDQDLGELILGHNSALYNVTMPMLDFRSFMLLIGRTVSGEFNSLVNHKEYLKDFL